MDIRDNICPTFMIWGICQRGHRCNLRHPSYRYLAMCSKQKDLSPELRVNEEPKPRDPNSYAAVVAKNKPLEPEKCSVDLRSDLMTKNSLKEEWPALGSPEEGLTTKAPKTWRSKRDSKVTEVWESTTLRGSWILDEKSKATADQIENDRLFAENLQGSSEYTQLSEHDENDEEKLNYNPAEQDYEENDEDNYNPVDQNEETNEDNDEDNYNPEEQKEETNGKNKISFGHQEIELTRIVASRALPKISRTCDICMDRPKDATLVCGHRYCYQCALQMRLDERVCAICRRGIVSVIKTYN